MAGRRGGPARPEPGPGAPPIGRGRRLGLTPLDYLEVKFETRLRGAVEGPQSELDLPLALDIGGSVSVIPHPRFSVGLVVGGTPVGAFGRQAHVGGEFSVQLGSKREAKHEEEGCSCELPEGDVPQM